MNFKMQTHALIFMVCLFLQSLEYEMPKGDEYPRDVTEKNRLLNILPSEFLFIYNVQNIIQMICGTKFFNSLE